MIGWLYAFIFTQIVEVPIYRRAGASYFVAFAASTITHPIVWFVFPMMLGDNWAMVAAAEIFAVIVEAIWLRFCQVRKPLFWSLAANGASFGLGLLSRALFGRP